MSAIAGFIRRDGPPAPASIVNAMLRPIRHRGSAGPVIQCDADAAMGWLGPAERERCGGVQRGDLLFVGDTRLDNCADLAAQLGLKNARVCDADIILAAYARWGGACAKHLLGDFAFAIWNAAARSLFCARDHFGIKPLFYTFDSRRFAFASEIKALLPLGCGATLNESAIAHFLAGLGPAPDETYFTDVFRLPAAHTLELGPSRLTVRPYWTLQPVQVDAHAAPTRFRALFDQAVRRRLGGGRVGAMLSGGLDSSSIVCSASRLRRMHGAPPLPVYSLIPAAGASERPYIDAVTRRGGCTTRYVAAADAPPFEDFAKLLSIQDGLFGAPNLAVSRVLYAAAAEDGVAVLLDGHGGDEVVSHAPGYLRDLAANGRFRALWSECSAVARIYDVDARTMFANHLGAFYPPAALLRRAKRAAMRRVFPSAAQSAPRPTPHIVNARVADTYGIAGKLRPDSVRDLNRPEHERHIAAFAQTDHAGAFETLDRVATASGVEPRYPFYDRDLVEFCVSLPASEKRGGGVTRLVLRRAMSDVLPPSVRDRQDKHNFAPELARGMLTHHRDLLDCVVRDEDGLLAPFADMAALGQARDALLAGGTATDGGALFSLWRAAALHLWLHERTSSPSDFQRADAPERRRETKLEPSSWA